MVAMVVPAEQAEMADRVAPGSDAAWELQRVVSVETEAGAGTAETRAMAETAARERR